MRRVVVMLLSAGVLAGVVAVVASGSDVASRLAPAAARSGRLRPLGAPVRPRPFPHLISRQAEFAPSGCSVATGACAEGCALPIASTPAMPQPASGYCSPSSTRPCLELIAAHPAIPHPTFCTVPKAPGLRIEPFPHRLKRGR